ncbi:MAG: LLM class flavin-dependent oxidoreductase [Geodermatophilaceae bacterium]
MPILIGGTGPRRTLRLVARHADVWHAMFPSQPAELVPAVAALRRWCAEEGRDAAAIEWGVGIEPDRIGADLALAAEYRAMGFTQFTLGVNGPAYDVEAVQGWLDWRDERNRGG